MSDCCSSTGKPGDQTCDTPRTAPCPACDTTARTVSRKTLLHQLRDPIVRELVDASYYFCANRDCEVVYFAVGGVAFTREVLRSPGYETTGQLTDLVCHCFDVAARQILGEVARGEHASRDLIAAMTREGLCECEVRNPSGSCCLKLIAQLERDASMPGNTCGE